MWAVAGLGGALAVLGGLLPADDAVDVLMRLAPVLGFLVAVTVLAELADTAGVFDVCAGGAARLAHGRTPVLFGLIVVVATVTTVVLSLDATAVLLTPTVLAMCARLRLNPLPFAMATMWLANTASLLLPVSNLTNLLAFGRLGVDPVDYVARMAAPAAAAVLISALVLGVAYRGLLRGRYPVPTAPRVQDRWLFALAAAACTGFAGLIVFGVGAAPAATSTAAVLAVGFALRRPRALRPGLLPWRLVVLVAGLFLLVEATLRTGAGDLLSAALGSGTSHGDLLRVAAIAMVASNLANNLPAYVALEPAVGTSVDRHLALLVGTNVGPLVTLWASLATLLWWDRCKARGVDIPARHVALVGLVGAPLIVLVTVAALLVSGP